MKKKLLSLVLVAGVLATGVFAGCGAKEEQLPRQVQRVPEIR